MDVTPRTSGQASALKFCSACGAPLEADAAFCTSCGAAPMAIAPATRRMPGFFTIPDSVWAGALEVFFALTTVVAFLLSGVTGAMNSMRDSFIGGGGRSSATVLLLLGILSLAQLSVQVALISGLLAQRRWARALYLWTLAPIVLVTLIIVAQGEAISGTEGFIAGVIWVGLTALQAFLVMRSEKDFVN